MPYPPLGSLAAGFPELVRLQGVESVSDSVSRQRKECQHLSGWPPRAPASS